MNIIIGNVAAERLRENYTVLELETFNVSGNPIKTYCVANNIPVTEIANLEQYKSLHQKMIDEYNRGNYKFCMDAMEHLNGKFGGDLDTFYNTIRSKISSQNVTL
jgi:hypothetical protein